MSARGNNRSADIPVLDSKPKRALENPRSFPGDGQGAEGNLGEDWGMSDWQICAVPDSFIENKVGRQRQIPVNDIAKFAHFPVVDQGQKFVAGYCDDESRGHRLRLATAGTKVLLLDKKLYDPEFYYFTLLALEIPGRAYNRHFTTLTELMTAKTRVHAVEFTASHASRG